MRAPRMTTREYFRTPETCLPQELVYGLVRDAPAPAPGHQWVVGEIFSALRNHLQRHSLGRVWIAPIDVVLDRDSNLVVQPDIIFVSHARIGIVSDRVWGAPDLVVEVMSPHPRIGRLGERLEWFGKYGVRECWLVHQFSSEIELIAFSDGGVSERRVFATGEVLTSAVLPTFKVPVDSLV
jgi:Uma2 family endonuclease